jgi:glycosyltransferase involved in cell wall biosynthesis
MRHFCLFSYEIFPFTRGGAGTYITSVSIRLLEMGNTVTLVLDVDENTFQRIVENTKNQAIKSGKLEFKLLSNIISIDSAPRQNFPSDAHWKSYLFSLAVESIHAHTPIDVLEFVDYCGPSYYTLLKRAATPHKYPQLIVIRMHNTIELIDRCASSNFLQSRIFDYWLERTAISLADRILSPGLRYWNEVAARLYSVPTERIVISPPCRALLPRIADGNRGKNIIFVGRISTIKGMDLFLQAMAEICTDENLISQFDQIRVVGPSESISTQDEEAILNYKIGIPQEKIQFLGNLSESDLIHELSNAQLAVFPNRCESFCYAAHEAHMVGVPLILSMIPAFRDHFVDYESAVFFNGHLNDLVSKIHELIIDSELQRRLSSSVLKHRKRYETVIYGPDIDEKESVKKISTESLRVNQHHGKDHYVEFNLTIVYFCYSGNVNNAHTQINRLKSQCAKSDVIILLECHSKGSIYAFGRKWDFSDPKRSPIDLLHPGLILMLSDEFILAPSFVERGMRMMAMMPNSGAILPVSERGRWGSAEYGPASDLFRLREGEPPKGFPLLMRLMDATPLQQLLHDRSPYTALTLLIELRAAGFALIDDIHPTCVGNTDAHSLNLPTRGDVSAFVKRHLSRYRDFELASNLVDEVQIAPVIAGFTQPATGTIQRILFDLHQKADDVVYLHVVNDKAVIYSVSDRVSGRELCWKDMNLYGEYLITEHKDRPLGILEMKEGSCLRVNSAAHILFNFAVGPTVGKIALITNNRCALLDTQHEAFQHRFLAPYDILEITAIPSFEMPSRAFHLAAYHYESTPNRLSDNFWPEQNPGIMDCCLFFEDPRDKITVQSIFLCHHAVQLHQQSKSQAMLVDEIAAHMHRLRVFTACFFGSAWVEVAAQLLEEFDILRVEFIVSSKAIWSPTVALQLLQITNLVERFQRRVGVLYPSSLAGYFPVSHTIRPYVLSQSCETNPLSTTDKETAIHIIIGRNPSNEPYMGHIAAVAKILHANAVRIEAISLPTGQMAQDRLFEFFGLTHLIKYYEKLDEHTALPGRKIVYLNPFPFGENIDNLRYALNHGWHTVISPYENILLGNPVGANISVATFWEDVEVIAQHLIKSIGVLDV